VDSEFSRKLALALGIEAVKPPGPCLMYLLVATPRRLALWKKKCIHRLAIRVLCGQLIAVIEMGVDHGQLKQLSFERCVCSS
jgi:hypothetical protein